MENENSKITWSAEEYEHKEKSVDWFWALGIIVVAGAAASILYKNYLFAIVIILGGLSMMLFSGRHPRMVEFEINKEGIRIDDYTYPYAKIKGFWIDPNDTPRKLYFESHRFFMPIITLPLEFMDADEVKAFLKKHIEEKEIHAPNSHKVMDYLGF